MSDDYHTMEAQFEEVKQRNEARLVAAAVLAEREACIAECEAAAAWFVADERYDDYRDDLRADGARACVKRLRARSQKPAD